MKNWYVVNVYAGFENKFSETLREKIIKRSMEENFGEILIPSSKKMDIRRGEKVEVDERHFPGYVLLEMEMTNDAWQLVLSCPKVTGFLGGGGKPVPISKAEFEKITNAKSKTKEMAEELFVIGEEVKICEGPFASFNGSVEQIDNEKSRLKVSVSIFGRLTPVEIGFSQVKKVV